MNHPEEIQAFLSKALKPHIPPLSIKKESQDLLEVTGTKPTMQGRQQVEGHYFASLILKPGLCIRIRDEALNRNKSGSFISIA